MVRCGVLDGHDPPSPRSPLLVICPRCNEKDAECESCGGTGRFRVTDDPRRAVPGMAYQVSHLAELYLDKGLPLVAGGMLDQPAWFVDAASFCVSDRERILGDRYGKA